MDDNAPTTNADSDDPAKSSDVSGHHATDRDGDAASMKSDDDAMSETGKSTCSSHPFSSPNPSEQDDGDPHGHDRRRGSSSRHHRRMPADSASTPRHVYPMSMRQQLALLKQMDPPSESPKSPAAAAHTTPTSTGRNRRIAKVHKKNDRGETPLHVAARKGEYRQCRRLLTAGALVNSADYAGWTALHEACSHGRFKVAKVLILGGADVNATGLDDESPLHDASYNGNKQLVWLLLRHGADKTKANKEGKLPIDLCEDEEVRKLLLGDRPIDSPPDSPESAMSDSGNDRGEGLSAASSPKHEPLHESSSESALLTIATPPTLPSSTTWPTLGDAATASSAVTPSRKTPEPDRDAVAEADAADKTLTPSMVAVEEDAAATTEPEMKEIQEDEKAEETRESEAVEAETPADEKRDERTPSGKRRASEPVENETPTSSKQARTESPDKNSEKVKSMRIRDQMRHQRFHQQQQRFQSAIGDKKRRGPAGGDLARSPRGRPRAAGVGRRQSGGSRQASPEKTGDVYDFHSSSDSEEQQTLSVQRERKASERRADQLLTEQPSRERKASERRADQLLTEQPSVDPLVTARSADVTPTPMDPAVSVAEISNSAPSTPSTSTAVHHSKKGRLLGLPALAAAAAAVTADQSVVVEAAGSLTMASAAEGDDATDNDRKVPPLRISLTKTPSEEDGQSGPMDVRARSAEPAEQQTSAKAVAKNASSDGSGNGQEAKAPRLTRSKLRAQGLQLDDAERASGVNLHPHKRKGPWRRSSAAQLPTPAAPVEQAAPAAPAPWPCSSSESAASLMKKNSYEGFRLMRRLIENGWSSLDANRNQPISRPYQPPPHYDNFLVNKKSYLLERTHEKQKPEAAPVEGLSEAMRQLFSKQQQNRDQLSLEHRIQRDRLRLFCEKETLRLRARAANANRPPLSAVRVVRESEIYNPIMVDKSSLTPKETTESALTTAHDALMLRLNKQKVQMLNRQKMEADAMHASQKMCWEAELKKIGELDFGQKWRYDAHFVSRVVVSDSLDLLPVS
uniref:Ankyrin repeat domain-containing protein 12 n=1 Tax=Plectus sambesii TaxID=2011161 RepID=A0A914X3Y0_9BILA